jgi:hypothetical protein
MSKWPTKFRGTILAFCDQIDIFGQNGHPSLVLFSDLHPLSKLKLLQHIYIKKMYQLT